MNKATIIEQKIIEKEDQSNGKVISINPTDLMTEIAGEKFNKYYLILASKIFKKRGWILHQRKINNNKRMFEYSKNINWD